MDLGRTEDGGEVVGNTLPGVGTQLDDKYLKNLSNKEAAELLDTIIHEAVHNTLDPKSPLQQDGDRSGYPYDQAKKRTTKELVDMLNKKRMDKLQCP